MSYLRKFEDIEAWQLARELTRKSNHQSTIINPMNRSRRNILKAVRSKPTELLNLYRKVTLNPEPLNPYR